MSGNSADLTTSWDNNKVGPDFFGFYTKEIAELLSQVEDLMPFPHPVSRLAGNLNEAGREKGSTKNSCKTKENNCAGGSDSLFSNGIGALLSEFKKERLKSLLRQSVFTLTQEVDEMIYPILSVRRLQSRLRCKNTKADQPQHPHKKLKASSCSVSISNPTLYGAEFREKLKFQVDMEREHMNMAASGKELSSDVVKKCIQCHATSTPQWIPPDGTKSLCSACGLEYANNLKNESSMNSDTAAGKESAEIDDDLRLLLEGDTTKVEELIKNYSNEYFATLHYMEQKLEKQLNIVMTSCRPMTIAEKQQLRKLIQNLPPRNLERVVEIIGRDKPSEGDSRDEVHVDLDELENITLWRLYFYVAIIQGSSQ